MINRFAGDLPDATLIPAKSSAKEKKLETSLQLKNAKPLSISEFIRQLGLKKHTDDMKFALLQVDQAIELLLKEKVRSSGISIYKNPKETISIWGAYEILEKQIGCNIPEKPDLELLQEERNSIQHKYANPSSEDATFHIDQAMKFIDRFVTNELNLNLKEYISSEYIEQILGT